MERTSDIRGYLILVLHAHLPYVRYPEHEYHLEESWLFEAITETYIPLLTLLEDLLNDHVDFRITLSLTPTLIEMFNDRLLRRRYQRYLDNLIELSEKELHRTRGNIHFEPVVRMYHERFLRIRHLFAHVYKRDLASSFVSLYRSGKVEIITSAATHAYLPALMIEPVAVRAQLRLAAEHFRNTFGSDSPGLWLPECGYEPRMDSLVKEAGFRYFFLESHSLLKSRPKSRYSIFAPVKTPSEIVAFARDAQSSKQVWSSIEGYPGDADYRDFYRDIGFDLDLEYVKPYLPGGSRTFTGLKYYRITDRSDKKKPYDIEKARKKAEVHARHFLNSRKKQLSTVKKRLRMKPLVTAAYDAELFGHWWFEGPDWLKSVLTRGCAPKTALRFVTPTEYISEHRHLQSVVPSVSSWGYRGYSATWIDPSNSWIYKPLHRAARLMSEIAERNSNARGVQRRALNQAARELLLAQASDWPFMMKTGNSYEFAKNKFKEHMQNFYALYGEILLRSINEKNLSQLENRNALFSDLDYRIFSENPAGTSQA